VWYIKVLAANDTLATRAHQAGPYIPKRTAFQLFPSLTDGDDPNPRRTFEATVDSHRMPPRPVTVIWYNQKTRDEARFTGWGGSASPLLDPEATGSLCVFAFHKDPLGDADSCRMWLCRNEPEEDLVVATAGPVEPGLGRLHDPCSGVADLHPPGPTEQTAGWPDAWNTDFPSADELARYAAVLASCPAGDIDRCLLLRRRKEYEVFGKLERLHVLPRIRKGFRSIDDFVSVAHSVTNRRKARSGRSLEVQTRLLLDEEKIRYAWNPSIEGHKRPDFLFPSVEDYENMRFPSDRLYVLAAKTTCRDRWRQILNEADRIPRKHLLTLQEGVSENQFREMSDAGVILVVPADNHRAFPKAVRSDLLTLRSFFEIVR